MHICDRFDNIFYIYIYYYLYTIYPYIDCISSVYGARYFFALLLSKIIQQNATYKTKHGKSVTITSYIIMILVPIGSMGD